MLEAWFLRPIGQPAGVKRAGNPAYTQLMGATRRLIGNQIAMVPLLSYAMGSWGRGFLLKQRKTLSEKQDLKNLLRRGLKADACECYGIVRECIEQTFRE
jgi:hypothetical protein